MSRESEGKPSRKFGSFSYPYREGEKAAIPEPEPEPKAESKSDPDPESNPQLRLRPEGKAGDDNIHADTSPPSKSQYHSPGTGFALGRLWRRVARAVRNHVLPEPARIASSEEAAHADISGLPPFVNIAKPLQNEAAERRRSSHHTVTKPGAYFQSRRVKDEEIDTSWLKAKKDPRQKFLSIIPLTGLFLGLCVSGVNIYVGYSRVPVNRYCLLYEDDFSSGKLNQDVWLQEVQVGGFGNGQFDETTPGEENVFVKDHMLHIQPTLQDERLLTQNATLNLLELGTCTATSWADCVATTNTTNGTLINPVKSGRINTSKGANLRFGRIEVVAKLPEGDWLWPGIWLFPRDAVYGTWPASGEIDIAESRGNNWTYPDSGNDIISSALHWGPTTSSDAWWRTYKKQKALHSTFSDKFHTYGLEWTDKYLYTYLDSRLLQVLYHKFSKPLWEYGQFAGIHLPTVGDIWRNGTKAAPFDQDFFLILDVAVGGTNGWFKDGMAGKPWDDQSQLAKRQFWEARDQWYPTWQNSNGPAMKVKSIKMWQLQGYNGCGSNAREVG